MSKYYTPEIEEFHVGFECELMLHELRGWEKHIFNNRESLDGLHNYISERIRVKYLDREDIEKCGWEQEDYDTYRKGDIYFEFNNEYKTFIYSKKAGLESNLFAGTIKNISELRKLMKQLGINE